MNTLMFQERLLHTTIARYRIWGIMLIVLAIFLVLDLVYKHKTKSKAGISWVSILLGKGNSSNRLTLNQQILSKTIAIILIALILGRTVVVTYNDIAKQQYCEAYVHISQNGASDTNFFSNGRICVVDNEGKRMFLELPTGYTEEEFPPGGVGTVWYSKESKVALAFISQDE